MGRKLTNEDIDDRLGSRPIIRLDDYNGSATKIRWECIDCSNVWEAMPSDILNKGSGCPKCSLIKQTKARTITDKDYILNLPKNIETLEPYIKAKTAIKHLCLICSNIWEVRPADILKGIGCPKCHFIRATKSMQQYVAEVPNNIKVLDIYINSYTKIRHKCLICDNTWKAAPYSILKGCGCPVCAKVSAKLRWEGKRTEALREKALKIPCSLYILENEDCVKIGISSKLDIRVKDLNREGFKCKLLKDYRLNVWGAILLEGEIHRKFKSYKSNVKFKGYTELHCKKDLNDILEYINESLKNRKNNTQGSYWVL